MGAFFTGKLQYNDYQILISFILCVLCLVVMAITLCSQHGNTWGITITVPFLHYFMAIMSLDRHLSTDFPLAVWEICMLIFAFLIQYGWGAAYFYLELLDVESIKAGEALLEGEFLLFYVVFLPLITSFTAMVLKFLEDSKRLTPMFWVLFSLTTFNVLLMLAISYVFAPLWFFILVIVIFLLVIWLIVNFYVYSKNNRLPKPWKIGNMIVFFICFIILFGLTFEIKNFSNFAGFTILVLGTSFIVLVYSLNKFRKNIQNMDRKPLFFSPWIFPVYRFSPKKNDVIPYNLHTVLLLSSLLAILLWSILAAVFLKPYWVGICISILIEITLLIVALYLISISSI